MTSHLPVRKPKKTLFIQHAGGYGGSCMSLLYTLQGLDQSRFSPVVALAKHGREVMDFYRTSGFECDFAPGLNVLVHTNIGHRSWSHPGAWRDWHLASISNDFSGLRRLLDRVAPDIVHLNGSPLAQSARMLSKIDVPFVWHVRDPPVAPADYRTRWLQDQMRKCRGELIFISEADRQAWVGSGYGHVLHNFVNTAKFEAYDGPSIRRELGIAADEDVILYLGGFSEMKGFPVLLEALNGMRGNRGIRCVMPGCLNQEIAVSAKIRAARILLPLIGLGTNTQRNMKRIARLGLDGRCLFLPFQRDVLRLMAIANVVVFPAARFHFARPVIEASAMGRAVIASDFPGMHELVMNGRTGLLVTPNDSAALRKAIESVLADRRLQEDLGRAGRQLALERFDREKNCRRFMDILDLAAQGGRSAEKRAAS